MKTKERRDMITFRMKIKCGKKKQEDGEGITNTGREK